MNKKNIFILSVLLLFTNQTKPGMTDDYFHKLWLFFCLEMGGTFMHECGHASFVALNQGLCKIYMGITDDEYFKRKKTDGRVNWKTADPRCAYTHIPNMGKNRSRIRKCEMAAFGPLYGMLYFFTMYKACKVFEHRFSPTLYNSLRLYTSVQFLKELLYGAVPLCPGGDTKYLYTTSGAMSEKRYDSVAAKNFTLLKAYAGLCLVFNTVNGICDKIKSDSSVAAFQRDNATLCFIYKITSTYALQYGLFGLGIDAIMAGAKEVHNKRNKRPENAPSPFDYVGGVLLAPLII